MDKQKLRIGVIGCGVIGQTLSEYFVKYTPPNFVIDLRFCDVKQELATALATRFGSNSTFTNYKDVIPNVDIVYVAVPPMYHHEVVMEALRAKKHVLCEKPMAISVEQAKEMISARDSALTEGHHLVTAINYPLQFVDALSKMKDLVNDGYVGEVRRAEIKFRFPNWPRSWQPYSKKDWINSKAQGGVVREIGSHFYFAVFKIFGLNAIKRVNAVVEYPKNDDTLCEIGALATMELINSNGSSFLLHLDIMTERPMEEEILFTIYGSKGDLSLVEFQYLFGSQNGSKLAQINKEDPYDPAVKKLMDSKHIVTNFLQAVANPSNPQRNLASFDIGFQTQQIIDAIYGSNGAWVSIDTISQM